VLLIHERHIMQTGHWTCVHKFVQINLHVSNAKLHWHSIWHQNNKPQVCLPLPDSRGRSSSQTLAASTSPTLEHVDLRRGIHLYHHGQKIHRGRRKTHLYLPFQTYISTTTKMKMTRCPIIVLLSHECAVIYKHDIHV